MRFAAIVFVAIASPLFSATEWLKISSPNFELYTTAGEKDARRTLEYFDQVRDFFMRVKSQQVTTRLPVTIIAFKNQKEYKPYSSRATAAAYFIGDEQRDYIVMGGVGQEHFPVAVHEYMHLLVRHSGLTLPVWLNEGLAEVYSTLTPYADKVLVGAVPKGAGYSLGDQKWFPVETMVRITHDSPEYNEKDRTGLFYAQSWLLTHMLMLEDTYGKAFGKFVAETSATGSAEGALQRVFGKTVSDVDRDLKSYYRSNSLKGVLFDTKLQKVQVAEPRPATDLETDLTLAKLTGLLRRREDAERRFLQLAKDHPNNWEVYEALGYLNWQEGDRVKAKEYLKRAVDLKPTSWRIYWDYARLAQGDSTVLDALRSALQLNPGLADARLMLGFELYKSKQYSEAYTILSQVKSVNPDRAASMFLVLAYSALEIGKKAEARKAAEMGKKHAKTAIDIAQANSILEFIDRPGQMVKQERMAPSSVTRAQPAEELALVRGVLQEIECIGKQARLTILTGSSRMSLLIRDPASVQLKSSDSAGVNFTCGPQKNTRVIVEYNPKADDEFKTTGDIATLELTSRQSQ